MATAENWITNSGSRVNAEEKDFEVIYSKINTYGRQMPHAGLIVESGVKNSVKRENDLKIKDRFISMIWRK